MLFFLLPGLLYLLLARRTQRVTIAAYPEPPGCRALIGGDDPAGAAKLVDWARGLAAASYTLDAPMEYEPPPEVGQSTPLADKLRELAKLKDSGLITEAEYEAKRRALLDRM